jgi:hypothetical protein
MRWARAHQDWLLIAEDECWFSRFAQPNLCAWAAQGDTLRLIEREAQPDDPEPKALACFGSVRDDIEQVYLYFCDGQPNSEGTIVMLHCLVGVARTEKKRVLVIIWDQASWHKSWKVQAWIQDHNRQAKETGDVRILTFLLPVKSPWLNPIEPRWIHAKRAVVEPSGELTAMELKRRLCVHFQAEPFAATLKQSSVEVH